MCAHRTASCATIAGLRWHQQGAKQHHSFHFLWCSVVHAALAGVLRELRDALRARGSDLLVVRGRCEEVVPRLAAAAGVSQVYAQQEVEHM